MIYINQENGHNKFWGYSSQETTDYGDQWTNMHPKVWKVTTYWGPIGRSLETCQRKDFFFDFEWEAKDFIRKKLQDKQGKGYMPLKVSYEEFLDMGQTETSTFDYDQALSKLKDKINVF